MLVFGSEVAGSYGFFVGGSAGRVMRLFNRDSSFRYLILLMAAVGVWGCEGQFGSSRTIDLVEHFPEARQSTETDFIDFQDAMFDDYLGAGWFLPRGESGARKPAWGVGTHSVVMFFRLKPQNITLSFQCRPFSLPDGRRQGVSFLVNGPFVGEVDLNNGMQEVEVGVPAEILRSGENILTMKYASSQRRSEPFSKPSTDRAVEWRWMRISPSVKRGGESAAVDRVQRELFIPSGTRIDFYLGPMNRAEFSCDTIEPTGDFKGRLIVAAQGGETPETVVGTFETRRTGARTTISGNNTTSIRISLAAVGRCSQQGPAHCGILLAGPLVSTIDVQEGTRKKSAVVRELEPRTSSPLNIVIYLIDALRADHLGCYGYDRPVSPRIDGFSESGVLFEKAQAQTSWTRASVASIFTGLMPQVHGANDDDDALSESVTTIAEYLQTAGYQTAGFSANGNAGPNVGFAQGFDIFRHIGAARSEELGVEYSKWLNDLKDDQPFFLWVHAVDPHVPYMPPNVFRDRFAPGVTDRELGSVARIASLSRHPDRLSKRVISNLKDLYDAEIAANDRSFGALLDVLKNRGLEDNTVVILLSDHGEEFYDHGGWTHGKTLYGEVLNIPLIIRFPGGPWGERIDRVVQHVDILPTILDFVGIDVPTGIQGHCLTDLLTEEGRQNWPNQSFSYLDLRGRVGSTVFDGRWKMIHFQDRGRGSLPKLFFIPTDHNETTDLFPRRPDTGATMLAWDARHTCRLPDPVTAPIVDTTAKREMREALKALGYIE